MTDVNLCSCCECGYTELLYKLSMPTRTSFCICPNCAAKKSMDALKLKENLGKRALQNNYIAKSFGLRPVQKSDVHIDIANGNISHGKIIINIDAAVRYFGFSLMPDEYLELKRRFGDALALGTDYYTDTGLAYNPVDKNAYAKLLKAYISDKKQQAEKLKTQISEASDWHRFMRGSNNV